MSSTTTIPIKRLSVDEVAEIWGLHRDQVVALIEAGKLKAANLGLGKKKRRYVIRMEDVIAAEEANAICGGAPPAKRTRKLPDVKDYFAK